MSCDLEKRIRRLEAVMIFSIVAGAICVVLVFAHLMHDANEFTRLWQAISEFHRNDHR